MTAFSIKDKRSLCWSAIAFLFLAVLLAIFIFPQTARADDARVYVDPASDGASVGSTYTVYIKVDNVTDLYGWSCMVDFDPTILQVAGSEGAWQITEGSFLKSGGASTWFNTSPTVNNTTGSIQGLMCTRLGSPAGVTGAGTLFSITFNVIGSGDSPITITPQLSNSYAQTIPCTVEQGEFKEITAYYFPWYDNVSMISYILISNPDFNSETAHVKIYIAGNLKWEKDIAPGGREFPKFPGVMDGPVKIVCTNGLDLVVSSRVHYYKSFNEFFATTQEQMDTQANSLGETTYYFPWYDNLSMISYILISNPDFNVGDAHVEVFVAGVKRWEKNIAPGGREFPKFPGLMDGPVKVVCTTGHDLVVSSRVHYYQSFNEFFATTQEQMDTQANSLGETTYYFPWYDNLSMISYILISNPDFNVGDAHVEVFVAGVKRWEKNIAPGGREFPKFPGLMDGPVKVVCTTGHDLVVSSRVHYYQSFNEFFATTQELMDTGEVGQTNYYFPWYDNLSMISYILISNPDFNVGDAHVEVWVAGIKRWQKDIPPGGREFPKFPGLMDGPVKVVCTTGHDLVVSSRVHYYQSFNEFFAITKKQL